MVALGLPIGLGSSANANVVGQGFTVSPADLAFILKQIKIAEAHSAVLAAQGPGDSTDPMRCQAMIGTGPNQIPSPLVSDGLRTVDGSCNNLQPGQASYGASDQTFPRLTSPVFKSAEDARAFGGPAASSYTQTTGAVVDSQPRMVSNLIVDQTSTNPAAIAAAGFPVRSQGNVGVVPCTTEPSTPGGTDGLPAGCVPARTSLDIPNVTTDVGLSPPFNAMFTIFGQFFDHGLDKITNGGNGTVFVPLKADDPLVVHGQDGIAGNADDVPVGTPMILTRGTIKTGADGLRNAPNTDTPFVDQSQTYSSHASHQVFLREYVDNTAGRPVSTGKFLSSPDGGLASWTEVKAQADDVLGLALKDTDVTNIPMIKTDPYGKFVPGAARGLPQYVLTDGSLVEGDRINPVAVPANAVRIGTAFLNDIAHSADPGSIATPKTPDANTTAGGSLDPVPSGQYDDELLGLHVICGDGRCNENIALQAVHQVFHNEHDRLIDDIKNVLTTDTSTNGVAALPEWKAALGADGWNGERLFQAARFVTEMEYQHLVFEEFARKVQPGINPFEPFAFTQTDVDPAITAEFAHAVYRFGHSMLTETIPRLNSPEAVAAGAPLRNDIDLFDGFLNPAAYHDAGNGVTLSSADAAGAIVMGLSDQVGQEIDEFVVETLRNNLLGLPLDLPVINLARARSEGIPPLNDVRRQIFGATNDGQLKPYTDWIDFGQQLKHPESLVNFVAAYGAHDAITSQSTSAGRRTAADRIVNGTILPGPDGILSDNPATVCADVDPAPGCDESADNVLPPADSADFMFGTGAWVNSAGKTTTGVDDIDLWMGGLAERTNLFGGLLGSTFNYVFENQLTDLQNGDRFYYLARTPGMNLRAQLEGNSFSELVMRNTNAHTLKADPFATADCKFELGNLTSPATSVGSSGKLIRGVGSVQDDPASECDENEHLLRMADGTWRYRMTNTAMPSGINAQAVYNGKAGTFADRVWGGADNDTFWGGAGNDVIEGGDGADVALGGEGNDIITDLAGDDVPKGGPGNDAIDGGPGLDIIMGGDGKDFTNGGANSNETFGGAGDDFAIAGQGMDAIFGDSGDDWEEGGDQPDLLIGDSSSFFFDDRNLPGHDILIGQGGDDDYDMEGGDDIGVAGPGVEKSAGAAGFDWQIGLADPQAQDMDLARVFVAGGLVLPGVRDKFNEVEALSGWNLNDTLRGDDVVPTAVGGGGFVGCDALDAAGVARIGGLDQLVTPGMRTVPATDLLANAATQQCLLTGNVWGAGNILLGGGGSDLLEGRGADDIIDGDRYVNVRLSVRTNPLDPASQIGTTELMTGKATSGTFGPGTAGMTLQQAVFSGLLDPGNIVAVREILSNPGVSDVDTALFSGPQADYDITLGTGVVTVAHTRGAATDGTDTVRNVERLQFSDTTVTVAATPPVAAAGGGAFRPVTPQRIVDTRDGTGSPATPLLSGATRSFQVTGVGGVPAAGVSAVVMNVTATGPQADGYLKVFPGGGTVPASSNLNFVTGQTVPNLVQVAVGATGEVSVLNGSGGNVDVVADVAGYVTTAETSDGPAGLFNPTSPFRILDTRTDGGAVDGGTSRLLKVTGTAGNGSAVPETGVSAVALNVTVAGPTADSYVTVYPGQQTQPLVSNLNFTAGQTVPNRVIVPVSPDGTIRLFNAAGAAHLVVDVNGWYTDATSTAGGAKFVALTEPRRVDDTRTGTGTPVGAGLDGQRTVTIAGTPGIPAAGTPGGPVAVVANITVTGPIGGGGSYLTVYPTGSTRPVASDLNFVDGQTVPNLTITKLSAAGQITLFNASGTTHVVTDVLGYFAEPTATP